MSNEQTADEDRPDLPKAARALDYIEREIRKRIADPASPIDTTDGYEGLRIILQLREFFDRIASDDERAAMHLTMLDWAERGIKADEARRQKPRKLDQAQQAEVREWFDAAKVAGNTDRAAVANALEKAQKLFRGDLGPDAIRGYVGLK